MPNLPNSAPSSSDATATDEAGSEDLLAQLGEVQALANHARLILAVTSLDDGAQRAACWGIRNLIAALSSADSRMESSAQVFRTGREAPRLLQEFMAAMNESDWARALEAGAGLIALTCAPV